MCRIRRREKMTVVNPTNDEARAIREGLKQPGEAYLHAILARPPEMLWLNMGPYCNMQCRHCYHDYGPHREGRMTRDVVDTVAEQLQDTSIDWICAGEGEPFADRELLLHMASTFPGLEIMTNGYWGDTAHERLEELQEAGFDLSRKASRLYPDVTLTSAIGVSVDDFHGQSSYANAVAITQAFRDVFQPKDKALGIHYTSGRKYTGEEFLDNKMLRFHLLRPLRDRLDGGGILYRQDGGIMRVQFENTRWMEIMLSDLLFVGRAAEIGGTEREYSIYDIRSPKRNHTVTVDHKGDVFFSGGLCRSDNLVFGNIFKRPLHDIVEEMMHDPLLKVMKLGDIGGLLTIMHRMGGPREYPGTSPCHICRTTLSDEKLLHKVRTALEHADLSDEQLMNLVYDSPVPA